MLHKETVNASTLALIQSLMKMPELQSFRLVGGTALSLQIGHRISTDIDLFTIEKEIDFELLKNVLESEYTLETKSTSRIGLFCFISDIKTDLVRQNGIWLDEPIEIEGIRLATLKDIAAMKIGAITGRGRKRDFFDIHELLNYFSLREMLNFFHIKFPGNDQYAPVRSLLYFEDAEDDNLLKNIISFDWKKIKQKIIKEVQSI